MRSVAGLLFVLAAAGCRSPATPCASCPSGCGPLICVERHHYCRRFDDWHAGLAARRCAHADLGLCPDVSPDYRRGYVQAYVDVARGATGAVPPIPPERYWSVCFRNGCGRGRADDWFAGYADGAARALTCFRGGSVPSSGVPYVTGPPHAHSTADAFPDGHAAPWNCDPSGW